MSQLFPELPPLVDGEIKTYQFDFSDALSQSGETIDTESVEVDVYSGTDASPSALLDGSATSSGTVVSQLIDGDTGGVTGAIYRLICIITTSGGQTLKQVGFLAKIPLGI